MGLQRGFDLTPSRDVLAVNRRRAHGEFFRSEDLVAHEREQRTDEQRRSAARVTQDSRREEINDAFAPACALNHEHAPAVVDHEVDGCPLAVAKVRRAAKHLPQQSLSLRLLHVRQESVRDRTS